MKKLVENAPEEIKRAVLRLGMAIRKENYDNIMEQYDRVKQLWNQEMRMQRMEAEYGRKIRRIY